MVQVELSSGDFIRVISGSGTDDIESNDGIVTLYAGSGLALNDNGGDQAMIYIGNAVGGSGTNCGGSGTPNAIKSAINFGNYGWLSPGSGLFPGATIFGLHPPFLI